MHEVTDSEMVGGSLVQRPRSDCIGDIVRKEGCGLHPAALLGLHIQCSFLTLHGPSDPTVGADQPNKRRGESLGNRTMPRKTPRREPSKPSGDGIACPPPCSPENRSPLRLVPWAGRTRGAPAWLSAYVRPVGGCDPAPRGSRRALAGAASLLSPRDPMPLPGDRGKARAPRPDPGIRGGRWRPPAAGRFPGEEQRIAQASGSGEGAGEGERRKRDLNERR